LGASDSLGSPGVGGNTIFTGTGAGDTVTVHAHTNADTFGFALGTSGSNFTTVIGAQDGDHIDSFGRHLVQASTTASTLSDYITSLGTISSGNTYVGYNGTDTFVVSDYHHKTGAIDIVGNFDNFTFSLGMLTLHP
jgi:hypothetical protein